MKQTTSSSCNAAPNSTGRRLPSRFTRLFLERRAGAEGHQLFERFVVEPTVFGGGQIVDLRRQIVARVAEL